MAGFGSRKKPDFFRDAQTSGSRPKPRRTESGVAGLAMGLA